MKISHYLLAGPNNDKLVLCTEAGEYLDIEDLNAKLNEIYAGIKIEMFRSRDGRVFTNVSKNGQQLAHLVAGDTWHGR